MRYIDKNRDAAAGNQVTMDYLNTQCLDANGHYCGITYRDRNLSGSDFLTGGAPHTYYSRMMDILLRNQDGLCCYCLRRIQQNHPVNMDARVSLEHIVPQSFTQNDNVDFLRYKASSSYLDDVQLSDVFEAIPGHQPTPPYPHKVAYGNMVASCKGTFPENRDVGPDTQVCCNHGRGNDIALPVYFWNDIDQLIDYTKDGNMYPKVGVHGETDIEDVIHNAKLHHDSLKDIRRVWYELSACDDIRNIVNCDTEDKRERLLTLCMATDLAINNPIESARLIEKFKKGDYWETLMLYDAFYQIMRVRYRG